MGEWLEAHNEWRPFYESLRKLAISCYRDAAATAEEYVGDGRPTATLDLNPSALHSNLNMHLSHYLEDLTKRDPMSAMGLFVLVEECLVAMSGVEDEVLDEDDPFYDLYGFTIAGFIKDLPANPEAFVFLAPNLGTRTIEVLAAIPGTAPILALTRQARRSDSELHSLSGATFDRLLPRPSD
jgi:hypothetical protein